jgi:hypothetical protein
MNEYVDQELFLPLSDMLTYKQTLNIPSSHVVRREKRTHMARQHIHRLVSQLAWGTKEKQV